MPTPILPRRCLASAFAAVIMLFEQSGITLAQTPGSTPRSPESKMNAKITQLQKTDTMVGTGAEAVSGKIAVVHYTGWLYDPSLADKKGRKFDSSLDRRSPFSFPLGGGRVIRGWDEGVAGMRVGGRRTLVIPPEMAYGSRGAGGVIPPDATLIFEVELVEVRDS
ncbi:MAG: FKBP-type peptidyl-prolyl cis-trans isomerase [Betaproteobacteria bacterium]|nr:MAG: FKBP-type peptidyl-prolyl cis-trans isomerase [Betaproteobacteria bacterium]